MHLTILEQELTQIIIDFILQAVESDKDSKLQGKFKVLIEYEGNLQLSVHITLTLVQTLDKKTVVLVYREHHHQQLRDRLAKEKRQLKLKESMEQLINLKVLLMWLVVAVKLSQQLSKFQMTGKPYLMCKIIT
jgi:hypothetical protein